MTLDAGCTVGTRLKESIKQGGTGATEELVGDSVAIYLAGPPSDPSRAWAWGRAVVQSRSSPFYVDRYEGDSLNPAHDDGRLRVAKQHERRAFRETGDLDIALDPVMLILMAAYVQEAWNGDQGHSGGLRDHRRAPRAHGGLGERQDGQPPGARPQRDRRAQGTAQTSGC